MLGLASVEKLWTKFEAICRKGKIKVNAISLIFKTTPIENFGEFMKPLQTSKLRNQPNELSSSPGPINSSKPIRMWYNLLKKFKSTTNRFIAFPI